MATSTGVKSMARSACDLGYNVVFVVDAMSDRDAVAHRHNVEKTSPQLGETDTSGNVLKLLRASESVPGSGSRWAMHPRFDPAEPAIHSRARVAEVRMISSLGTPLVGRADKLTARSLFLTSRPKPDRLAAASHRWSRQ
jgi:hypothetical protein